MTAIYELGILGAPTTAQVDAVRTRVQAAVEGFGLSIDTDVGWRIGAAFAPSQRVGAAALYFGHQENQPGVGAILAQRIPVIPVVSAVSKVHSELPPDLRVFNALAYEAVGPDRTATALLESAGLLRRQRRVFLSYRRSETREAALQLFDELSERQFEVFVDTHAVLPGEEFQQVLWHRLCDADVLLMLDSPGYFESRWTSAEFGRALAKGIVVLRVGWPSHEASRRTHTASQLQLAEAEYEVATGRIIPEAVERIARRLEAVRSLGIAVRRLNLINGCVAAIEQIGGTVSGVDGMGVVHAVLPQGSNVTIIPEVGVPTSLSMYRASTITADRETAVFYDHVGMHPEWLEHLAWLGTAVPRPRWIRASEAAWSLAEWEVQ